MTPKQVAAVLLILGWICLAMAFLTGCSSFGPMTFSLESDYGRFSYQLPELPDRTLHDK